MNGKKRYTKQTVGPHSKKVRVNNPIKKFSEAYQHISKYPDRRYKSRGGKDFIAEAGIARGGNHPGGRVIRFRTAKSTTRAYRCCWNYQSNCGTNHIDIFTTMIRPIPRMDIRMKARMDIRMKTLMKKVK